MTPSTRTRRLLVIEDHKDAAERLTHKLATLTLGPSVSVTVTPLVREHAADIRAELSRWYPRGRLSNSNYIFDFTSLDIIFQTSELGDEADGGVQLYEWLAEQPFAEHLGQLVIRTYSATRYFHGKFFNGLPVIKVDKNNQHEIDQWEDILA